MPGERDVARMEVTYLASALLVQTTFYYDLKTVIFNAASRPVSIYYYITKGLYITTEAIFYKLFS